ncbi:MAG: DoxX family protein [Bacteroidota bacterium]
MLDKKNAEPILVKAIRIITGLTFIFSAVVKGIDPIGTDYRIVDYLDAYGWYFLTDLSFSLAVLLISVEFLLGVAFLLKLRIRLASIGILLIMIFFTFVTYFDARYNLVPDCGCFGDAIKISNWQTFYKNIILLIFALIVFVKRNKIARRMRKWMQLTILIILLAGFNWFIFHNYNHLPVVDFRDWKVGNDMKSSGQETVKNYLIYKNISTGEIKEYISPNYPWNDSVWMSEWEFVNQRIDNSQLILKHGIIIEDEAGNNITQDIIENPRFQLILTSDNLEEVVGQGMIDASNLFNALNESSIDLAMLTNSMQDVDSRREVYAIDYDVFIADDIELKAMIRSNPGLVLLNNGIVVAKWHHNDFPKVDEIKELIAQ